MKHCVNFEISTGDLLQAIRINIVVDEQNQFKDEELVFKQTRLLKEKRIIKNTETSELKNNRANIKVHMYYSFFVIGWGGAYFIDDTYSFFGFLGYFCFLYLLTSTFKKRYCNPENTDNSYKIYSI